MTSMLAPSPACTWRSRFNMVLKRVCTCFQFERSNSIFLLSSSEQRIGKSCYFFHTLHTRDIAGSRWKAIPGSAPTAHRVGSFAGAVHSHFTMGSGTPVTYRSELNALR